MSHSGLGLGFGVSYRRLLGLVMMVGVTSTVLFLWIASSTLQFPLKQIVWKGDFGSDKLGYSLEQHDLLTLSRLNPGDDDLLFLSLSRLRNSLKTHPWIKDVQIRKQFPHQLDIEVTARQPVLIFQTLDGQLRYLDEDGEVFGETDLKKLPSIPIVQGVPETDRPQLREIVKVSAQLRKSLTESGVQATLGSFTYDSAQGYRVWISYPYVQRERQKSGVSRSLVLLGKNEGLEAMENLAERATRLSSVLAYLSSKGVPAREIYAEESKKIVVQIRTGS